MTTTLAVTLQKGGVGKTTTCLNLGTALARSGKSVLLIDLDPQGNLTTGLGIDAEELNTAYEVLLNPQHGLDIAITQTAAGVDLIPATLALAGAEIELNSKIGRETLLTKAIRNAQTKYDYILIDTPPSLGIFTINALAAADSVLVPLQSHVYALRAMHQLEATIELIRDINPNLAVSGIVLTMVTKTNLSATVEEQARASYNDIVFNTTVPQTIRAAEAPATATDLHNYAPQSPAAKAYEALAAEVIKRYE